MGCTYLYRGHRFTERQLDEFLMNNGIGFIDEFGDEVFSTTTTEQQKKHKDIWKYREKAQQVRYEHIKKMQESNDGVNYANGYLEIGDDFQETSKYKPITHFLKGLKSILTDKLLMPEFILENYFKEREKDWRQGNFKKDEFDLFFPDKVKPETITTEMLENFKVQLQEMWKAEADIGSEIHKACQIYFSGGKYNGKKGVQFRNLPKKELIEMMKQKLDTNLLSDRNIEQIYNYCFNLHQNLREKYGCEEHQDLNFYTELTVYGDVYHPETQEPTGLIGMIDLLVVDPKGGMHIIDYKTSPHDYFDVENTEDGYSSAKKLAFTYQLNIYERLLYNALNINPIAHSINVAPIQLKNFRKYNDQWVYDSLDYDRNNFIDNLTLKAGYNSNVKDNLDLMIPEKRIKDVDGVGIFNKVGTAMEELFQVYNRVKKKDESGKTVVEYKTNTFRNSTNYTIEDAKDYVDSRNPKENDKGEWTMYYSRKGIVTAKTKNELYEKIRTLMNNDINRVSDNVNTIKIAINEKDGSKLNFGSRVIFDDQEITWAEDFVSEYCDGTWNIVQLPPELEAMGCILLKNKYTNTFDIIKVSHNICTAKLNQVEGRTNLTAKFESDIVEDSKSDSFMLKAKRGNIDLMEVMLAINLMPNRFEDVSINKIKVINPSVQDGMTASARELKYCFKALRNHAKSIDGGKWKEYMAEDNFENGKIHICSATEQALNDFKSIIKSGGTKEDVKSAFEKSADEIQQLALGENPVEMLEKLKTLRSRLESKFKYLTRKQKTMQNFGYDNVERLYSELDIAIAELEGIEFRQQNIDPLKYGTTGLFEDHKIFKGHTGLYTDNPGTMDNYNINLLTSVVMAKHQLVKNAMQDGIATLRNIMERLKEEESFNYLKERLGGNKVNLFKGITRRTADGDWVVVDPETLYGAKKEFAEYFLKTVNENRFGKEKAEQLKRDGRIEYYRVPLVTGGSMWQVNSAMETLKFKFRSLLPKEVLQQAKDKIYNLLSESDQQERNIMNNAQWVMTTNFDGGEKETVRLSRLNNPDTPIGYFENDLEKLLLMHMQAYETKRAMDDVLPILRAGQVFQIFSKLSQNKSYKRSLEYLQDYIKVTIFNKPLISDRQLLVNEYAKKFMGMASKMALGFSPRQMYQGVEGIWKGIGLILRNPTGMTLDGIHQFNKDDFIKSFFNTMQELGHFGNRRSKLELLNEKYGMNDMDTNVYASKILDDHSLIYNFNTFLFRMASRPDFYNRLTIFQTQMRADGTWDAHSVVDGKLVYDWYKDARFSALSSGNRADPLYNRQFALYKEMFEQMQKEKLIDPKLSMYDENGKLRPLPEAYTIQQSESYKALADMMYGYYSHEKRSLMQASLIGGLVLQMYTYWSGKKNQYLAVGSIKNQGKYVYDTDTDGKQWYYQLDENGLPDYTKAYTKDPNGAPVIKWQGSFSEGIFTTLSNIAYDVFDGQKSGRTISDVWKSYWDNDNENLKTIYRSNITQLLYELSMFTLVGGFVGNMVLNASKEYVKEYPSDDSFAQAMTNTGIMLGSNIFKNSFLDLNFLDSIGGRGINWTPFAITYTQRTFQNWGRFFFGDKDFLSTLRDTWSATRQFKELDNFIRSDLKQAS